MDRCLQILDECGYLPTCNGLFLVNLLNIPNGLNADELERYLREHGSELLPGPKGFHASTVPPGRRT
jgi:hypothetical protein